MYLACECIYKVRRPQTRDRGVLSTRGVGVAASDSHQSKHTGNPHTNRLCVSSLIYALSILFGLCLFRYLSVLYLRQFIDLHSVCCLHVANISGVSE